mgnify:CR=1 FL=1
MLPGGPALMKVKRCPVSRFSVAVAHQHIAARRVAQGGVGRHGAGRYGLAGAPGRVVLQQPAVPAQPPAALHTRGGGLPLVGRAPGLIRRRAQQLVVAADA